MTTDRQILESIASDCYKDAFGFRPRHIDFSEKTDAELNQMIDGWVAHWQEEARLEAEYAEERKRQGEAMIVQFVERYGAPDRAAAKRWMAQAEG